MSKGNETATAKPEQGSSASQNQTSTDQNGQSHATSKPTNEPADAAHTVGTGSGGTQHGK